MMIDAQGYLKVIDFGLACYRQPGLTHQVCTLWYRAPEILFGRTYGCQADLWFDRVYRDAIDP